MTEFMAPSVLTLGGPTEGREGMADPLGPSSKGHTTKQQWRCHFKRSRTVPALTGPADAHFPLAAQCPGCLLPQERVLLDFWTSESFYKVGAVGACAFLLLFAVLMGPPPSDGRCTLPWC